MKDSKETTRQFQAHELCALFILQYKFYKIQERIQYVHYLTQLLFREDIMNPIHDIYQILAAKKFIRWVRLFDKPVWEHLNRPIPELKEVSGKILWEGKDVTLQLSKIDDLKIKEGVLTSDRSLVAIECNPVTGENWFKRQVDEESKNDIEWVHRIEGEDGKITKSQFEQVTHHDRPKAVFYLSAENKAAYEKHYSREPEYEDGKRTF
jgi:hypothetical protein